MPLTRSSIGSSRGRAGFCCAAALKGGAGAPQVISYTTAWSLYTIQRLFNWEIHMMSPRVVWLRAAVSLPLPILAGLSALLLGKP